jgi:hypothetical protein
MEVFLFMAAAGPGALRAPSLPFRMEERDGERRHLGELHKS